MIEILDKGFNIWTLVIVQQIDIDVNLFFLPLCFWWKLGILGDWGYLLARNASEYLRKIKGKLFFKKRKQRAVFSSI